MQTAADAPSGSVGASGYVAEEVRTIAGTIRKPGSGLPRVLPRDGPERNVTAPCPLNASDPKDQVRCRQRVPAIKRSKNRATAPHPVIVGMLAPSTTVRVRLGPRISGIESFPESATIVPGKGEMETAKVLPGPASLETRSVNVARYFWALPGLTVPFALAAATRRLLQEVAITPQLEQVGVRLKVDRPRKR